MSSRRHRRHSLKVQAGIGLGKAMILSAAIPLIIVWYTIKVLAILTLAVHDVVRGYFSARRLERELQVRQAAISHRR